MKIIKQGKSKEELEAILKAEKRFECSTCGCVFTANNDEYRYEEDYIYYSYYYCECPNCGNRAHEVRMR